jgi:hypothetical protein
MRNAFRVTVVLLCIVVLSAGFVVLRGRHVKIVSGSRDMRVVALSGERLVTPFDGLSPDSRYEWKKVSARTTPGKCQGQTQSSKLERLLISLGLETVAYAQCTSCPAGGCMGQLLL